LSAHNTFLNATSSLCTKMARNCFNSSFYDIASSSDSAFYIYCHSAIEIVQRRICQRCGKHRSCLFFRTPLVAYGRICFLSIYFIAIIVFSAIKNDHTLMQNDHTILQISFLLNGDYQCRRGCMKQMANENNDLF